MQSRLQQPFLYSENRKRAMQFVLQRYATLAAAAPAKVERPLLFVFGDFNFRLNALTLVKVRFNFHFCSPR